MAEIAPILVYQMRSKIGSIVPDCVTEEVMDDRAQITTHPVEKGSNISDHAFMLPLQVEMKVAWADYKTSAIGHSVQEYFKTLQLQSDLEPLEITTSKRQYKNMLIEGISVTVDEKTPTAVLAIVRAREVRFANSVVNSQMNVAPQRFPDLAPPTSGSSSSTPPTQENKNRSASSPPDASDVILPSKDEPMPPLTPPLP